MRLYIAERRSTYASRVKVRERKLSIVINVIVNVAARSSLHTKKEYLAFVYVKTIIYFDDGFSHFHVFDLRKNPEQRLFSEVR